MVALRQHVTRLQDELRRRRKAEEHEAEHEAENEAKTISEAEAATLRDRARKDSAIQRKSSGGLFGLFGGGGSSKALDADAAAEAATEVRRARVAPTHAHTSPHDAAVVSRPVGPYTDLVCLLSPLPRPSSARQGS